MKLTMSNQRDTTEYKNLALWKEKEGYVIRKGFGRVGCYIDRLRMKDLTELYQLLNKEIKVYPDLKWREVNEHKRLIHGK
jgi:hypothetical protein